MSINFEPYLQHLALDENCSPQAIRAQRHDLRLFAVFAEQQSITRSDQVNHVTIFQYTEFMRQKSSPGFWQGGLSDAFIARRLAALNSYFEYVHRTGEHELQNPTKGTTIS